MNGQLPFFFFQRIPTPDDCFNTSSSKCFCDFTDRPVGIPSPDLTGSRPLNPPKRPNLRLRRYRPKRRTEFPEDGETPAGMIFKFCELTPLVSFRQSTKLARPGWGTSSTGHYRACCGLGTLPIALGNYPIGCTQSERPAAGWRSDLVG